MGVSTESLSPSVFRARCYSYLSLLVSLSTTVGFASSNGFIGAAGGLCGAGASYMLICAGPRGPSKGRNGVVCALVLYVAATLLHVIGAYSSIEEATGTWNKARRSCNALGLSDAQCDESWRADGLDDRSALMWTSGILDIVAAVFEIIGLVLTMLEQSDIKSQRKQTTTEMDYA